MGKTNKNKNIPIKPILKVRVCCKSCFEAGRKDPWLRRLYVVWAAPPAEPAEGEDRLKPVFDLAQSDGRLGQEGYLSPLTASGMADPKKTVSMVKDVEYFCYFCDPARSVFPGAL